MTLSKNAIGNLLNRYKAVLSKCRILNTFGTLAIAGMLIMGGAGLASATAPTNMSEIGTAGFTDAPALDAVLGAGTMTAPSGGVTIEFGGISGATDTVINVDGLNNTEATNITLNGSNSGGVLSEGNIIVNMTSNDQEYGSGFTLNIISGTNASIAGDLILNGSNNSFGGRQAAVNVLGNTALTINGDLTLIKGADLNIGQVAGSTDSLTVNNLTLGSADSTQTTILAIGSTAGGTANVTANNVSVIGENINIWKGSLTTDTISFSGDGVTNVGVSTLSGAKGNITVNNGAINLTDGYKISIGQGTVTANTIYLDAESQLILGNNMNAIDPKFIAKSATNLSVDSFTGTVGTSGVDGKIAIGNTGIFQVDNILTLTGGGNLHMYEDNGTGKTASGSIAAQGLVFDSPTSLTGGHINLIAGSGAQELKGALTVNNTAAESIVTVTGGTWVADSRLTITDGKLVVNSGASFNAQQGLTIAATTGSGQIEGTLIANLADFGVINTTGAVGNKFDTTGANVGTKLIGDASATLELVGSGATKYVQQATLDALSTEIGQDIFGSGFGGTVNLVNAYNIGLAPTLTGIGDSFDNPNDTIGAGELTHEGTLTVAGLVADPIDATKVDSTIVSKGENASAPITLTLTGQGAANGVLSKGDITASFAADNSTQLGSGIIINLGNGAAEAASIEGDLTLHGSNNSFGGRQAVANVVGDTALTIAGDLTLTKGADLNIAQDAGTSASLTVNNLTLGSADSTQTTILAIGKSNGGTGNVTAKSVNVIGQNINLWKGSLTTDTMTLSGAGTMNVGLSTLAGVAGNVTVNNGAINLTDGYKISLGQGTVTANTISVDADSQLIIGSSMTAINPKFIAKNATSLAVDSLTGTASATGVDGKIAIGNTGVFEVQDTLTLTGGGNLNLYGTNSSGSAHSYGATIAAQGLTLSAATTLTAGHLYLLAGGTGTLSGAFTVNNTAAESTVTVAAGGAWTADSRLTITDGNLVVEGTASLDVSKGLTVGADGIVDLSGTLTADIVDFGTVDLTAASGAQFSNAGANIATALQGTNGTLTLTTTGDTQFVSQAVYDALLAELEAEIFASGVTGTVNLEAITVMASTLNGITAKYNLPEATIGAGELTYEGTTTLGGLVADPADATKVDSTIVSQGENATAPITLNLTGQGAANGVLSKGDITASFAADNSTQLGSGIILNLGSGSAASIEGDLTLHGSNNSFGGRQAVANVVGNTALTIDGDLTLTKGADLNIAQDAGTTASLTANNITLGSGDSTQTTILSIGKSSGGTGSVTANSVTVLGENINVWKGSLTANTMALSGAGIMNVGVSTVAGAAGNITVNSGALNLTGGYKLSLGQGTITANSVSVDASSQLILGNNMNAINPKFIATEATSLSVDSFTGTASATGVNGKIAIGNTGVFEVQNTLTLTGGGELNLYGTNSGGTAHSYGATIAATGLTLDAATTLTAGHLNLLAGGTGALSGALTVNNTAAESTVTVNGNWTTDALLTVSNGKLIIASGATLTTGDDVNTSGANAQLQIAENGKIDISGDTLTANLDDFGSLNLNTGAFTEGGTVDGSIVGDAGATLVLEGSTASMLYADEYNKMIADITSSIGSSFDGTITVSGISKHSVLDDLTSAEGAVDKVVGAGTYTDTGASVVGALIAADRDGAIVDSTINSDGGSLSIAGISPDRILSKGNLTVAQGILNLGYDGAAKTEGGTVQGDLVVNKSASASAPTIANIYGDNVTINNVRVENGLLEVKQDAKLSTESLTAKGASSTVYIAGNADIANAITVTDGADVQVTNGNAVVTAGSISVTGSDSSSGTGSFFASQADITTNALTVNTGGELDIAAGKTITVNNLTTLGGTTSFSSSTNDANVLAKGGVNISEELILTNASLATHGNVSGEKINLSNGANLILAGTTGGTIANTIEASTGTVTVSSGTWTAQKDISVSGAGSLQVLGGSLDVSGVNLAVNSNAITFSVEDGATLKADVASFGSFDSSGNFDKSASMEKQLDLNISGSLLLTGMEGTEMTKAEQVSLYRDADFDSITSNTSNIILNGVTFSGLYSLSLMIDGTYNEAIMAGDMNHASNTAASFTGIVANGNIVDSTIASGKTLTLTGANGQALLDQGSLTNSGTLNLGSANADYTASFNGDLINTAGTTTLLSSVTLTGTTEVSGGSLVVNAAEKTITTGNVSIASGAGLDIQAGTLDASAGTLTVDSGATFEINSGATLKANVDAYGSITDQGAYDATGATVAKDFSGDGTLELTGFDFADMTYDNYAKLLDSSTGVISSGTLKLNGVTIDLTGKTLTDLINGTNVDSVVAGGEVTSGENIVVGGVTGDADVKTGGTLTVNGVNGQLADNINVETGGTANLGTGSIAGDLGVVGTANVLGDTTVDGVIALDGGTVNVGNEYHQGNLTGTVQATGGEVIYHDPAWQDGVEIAGASSGVYAKFVDATGTTIDINAKLVAGQNSYVVLGDVNSAWAQESFNRSGLTWGQNAITSALFIKNPQTLDATHGGIMVDGSLTAAPSTPAGNTATFANSSLLVVDANSMGSSAALTSTDGTLTVADNAKLLVVGGTDGQKLTVVNGFTAGALAAGTSTGWDINGLKTDGTTNVHFDNRLFFADAIDLSTAGSYVLTIGVSYMDNPFVSGSTNARYEEAANAYGGGDIDSDNRTSRYIGRLFSDSLNGNASQKELAIAMTNYDNPAAAINVPGTTMHVGTAIGNAVIARNSAIGLNSTGENSGSLTLNNGSVTAQSGTNGGSVHNTMADNIGLGVWINPLYKWSSVSGMDASNSLSGDYETGFGGVALGMDYTSKVARDSALRFGLALNVGAGYTEGSGDMDGLQNSFDFWGLSAYAAFQKQNFVATLDVGYSSVLNDVTYSGLHQVGASSADVYSNAWSAGLNLEYTFMTDFMNITPHAGVRYMGVNTYGYSVDGIGAAQVEDDTQNVWYFPVGVTLSKNFVSNSGWAITPKLDVGFIAAAGDLEATSKAHFNGLSTGTETFQNVDGFAFNGGLGIDIAHEEKGISFGLNYNLQASENETDHMIFANFRYDF